MRPLPALFSLALLAAALPLTAQEPRWTPLGPFGGSFWSLAVHPTDPRIVYAGGTAGLVKSRDAGGHWTTLALNPSGLLALDPSRPETVYATGYKGFLPLLFKSVDGGVRWASVTDSLPFEQFEVSFSALAVDPAVPSRLFLGTTGKGLWRSPDRGASWELAVQGLPDGDRTDVAALAAAPKPHSGTAYLGAGSRGLFRSVNAGGSWNRVPGLPAARVTALVIAPSDPRTIYVAFQRGVLFRSANAGASWRRLQRTPFGAEITRLAVSPRSPGTVYAVDAGGRFFRTPNGGAQWTPLSSGLRTADVAVAPSDARTVYAGGASTRTDLGGIARSTDAGARFRKVNEGLSGLDALSLALDPAEPATLWAGVRAGLFRGHGDPPSWESTALRSAPSGILVLGPGTLVALIGGEFGASPWKTEDSGITWREIPFPTFNLWGLWLDPGNPGVLYATTSSAVFRGDDEGTSWTPLSEVPLTCGFTAFLAAPAPAGPLPALYAGGADAVVPGGSCQTVNQARVLRSVDGGVSWLPSEGLPQGLVIALAVDPVDPRLLYAGIRDVPGVWKSLDQGKTWTRTELDDESIAEIAVSPVPGRVYAATPDGRFFRSADGGATWSDWSAGLKVKDIHEILVDPDDPDRVYLASSNGVWKLEDTP